MCYIKNICLPAITVFLAFSSHAAEPVTGGWKDFGVSNADTVITLNCQELAINANAPLFYADFRDGFTIEADIKLNTHVTEQAFLCKEGSHGEMLADLSVGFDPGEERIFAEIKDKAGNLHRIRAGEKVEMVEKDGKFYYYVTLDDTRNGKHMIDVAVSDSPLGPFVPARKDGTPLITDDMTTDSHRANADIDPTVLIDDDGTAWIAWGNGDCYLCRLKPNMVELDGDIIHLGLRNYSEGPWLFKRNGLYYNVYAADAPGVQPEQIAYSTASSIEGPWEYRGLLTGPAHHGFTIHPSVNEFKGKWYFFYHDGSYMRDGEVGGDCRRQVCVEELHFNPDGSIAPITLTERGIAAD